MTTLRDTVVRWVDQRIEAVLAAPPMWGSPEAVELQVLLLLEVRALALRPDQTLAEPRRVLDTYIAHLAQRFPQGGSRPLHELIAGDDEVCSKLAEELRRFDELLRRSVLTREDLRVASALEHRILDTATATLVFGGDPVVEARALDAAFGAEALRAFQSLVSTTAATRGGRSLASRGPIPDERGSRLFITGTVQGSFGFELEELRAAASSERGQLRETVEEVARLLEATHVSDEVFEDAVSKSNPRVLTALARFLSVLDAAGATLHLSAGERVCALDTVEATRAGAERARRMRMTEGEQELHGVLLGVLPIARRFEIRVEGSGEIVDGRLTDEIEDLEALVGMRCVASVWVVTLARPGKEQRAYYLTGIRAAPAD
jgi:hypothetical protein